VENLYARRPHGVVHTRKAARFYASRGASTYRYLIIRRPGPLATLSLSFLLRPTSVHHTSSLRRSRYPPGPDHPPHMSSPHLAHSFPKTWIRLTVGSGSLCISDSIRANQSIPIPQHVPARRTRSSFFAKMYNSIWHPFPRRIRTELAPELLSLPDFFISCSALVCLPSHVYAQCV
jgi:hypothetical protein